MVLLGLTWKYKTTGGSDTVIFTMPIAAEHKESNIWGYASGRKSGRIAWGNVAVQLTRTMDTILRTVRDMQS